MAIIYLPKESFSYGEISPGNYALVSSDQFQAGCRELTNGIITRLGGVRKRHGSRVWALTPGNYTSRIFTYRGDKNASKIQNYGAVNNEDFIVMLTSDDSIAAGGELGQWLTVYAPFYGLRDFSDGQVHSPFPDATVPAYAAPGTIAPAGLTAANSMMSPYQETQLEDINSVQYKDRLYFLHPDHPPTHLRARLDDSSTSDEWDWSLLPSDTGSPKVVPIDPPTEMSYTAGSPNVIEATSEYFLPANAPTVPLGNDGDFWRVGGTVTALADGTDGRPLYGAWYRTLNYISGTKLQVVAANTNSATSTAANWQVTQGDASDWAGPYVYDGESRVLTWLASTNTQDPTAGGSISLTGTALNASVVGSVIHQANNGTLVIIGFDGPSDIQVQRISTATVSNGATVQLHVLGAQGDEFVPTLTFSSPSDGSPVLQSGHNIVVSGVPGPITSDHELTFDNVNGTSVGGDVLAITGSVAVQTFSTVAKTGVNPGGTVHAYQIRRSPPHAGPYMNWGLGWSKQTGFPTTGTVHQDRLYLGGMAGAPSTIVSSKTGDPLNWAQTADDDSGLRFDISHARGSRIRWMQSFTDLLVGTDTHEYKISGQPITPADIGVDLQTSYGGAGVPAVSVAGSTLFIGRGGRNIRDYEYVFDRDRYLAADLTDFAEHIFDGQQIIRTAYAQNPDQLLYVVSKDSAGTKSGAILTYRKENRVLGWSPMAFGASGEIEDVAWYPSPGTADGISGQAGTTDTLSQTDYVAAIMKYTINGATARHLVLFGEDWVTDSETSSDESLLPGLIFTNLFQGGTFLNTEIQALGDGIYVGDFTMSGSGVVDWSSVGYATAPTEVRYGLGITLTLTPTLPEFLEPRVGGTQGRLRQVSTLKVLLNNTKGLIVEGSAWQGVPGTPATAAVTAQTGWFDIAVIGESDSNVDVTLSQTAPYLCEIGGINFALDYST